MFPAWLISHFRKVKYFPPKSGMGKEERVDPPRAAATPPAGGDTAHSASSSFSTDSTARPEVSCLL